MLGREYEKLADEVRRLRHLHNELWHEVKRKKHDIKDLQAELKDAQDRARAHAELEDGQFKASWEEHQAALREVRDRRSILEHICQASALEAHGLLGCGLEPASPLISVEAWVLDETGEPRLLAEQWLPDHHLLAAHPPPLRLVPRLLLANSTPGKPSFFNTQALATSDAELNLTFRVRSTDTTGHGRSRLVLSHFHLVCQSHEHEEKDVYPECPQPQRVFLRLWMWGEDKWSNFVPGMEGGLRADQEMRAPQQLVTVPPAGLWRLDIVGADGTLLVDLQAEARPIDFDATSMSTPFVLGRSHRSLRMLLAGRPELLKCISREHLAFSASVEGGSLLVKNLSANLVLVDGEVLSQNQVVLVQPGTKLSFTRPASSVPASDATSVISASTVTVMSDTSALRAVPFLELELRAWPDDRSSSEVEDDNDDSDDDGLPTSSVPAKQWTCVNSRVGLCQGVGGDALYQVFSATSTGQIYCSSCFVASHAAHSVQGSRAAMLPRATYLARRKLLFESPAEELPGHDLANTWQVEFSSEVEISHPPQASTFLAEHRRQAQECLDACRNHHVFLASQATELQTEILQNDRVMQSEARAHMKKMNRLAGVVGASHQDVRYFRHKLEAAESFLDEVAEEFRVQEERAVATAEEVEAATAHVRLLQEKRQVQAEAIAAARARQPRQLVRAVAGVLQPRKHSKLTSLNHRRLLRVMSKGHGLLYRDRQIEVHVRMRDLHCPFDAGEVDVTMTNLNYSLLADVAIHLRALPVKQDQKTSEESDVNGSIASNDDEVKFAELQIDCVDVETVALDVERRTEFSSLPSSIVEQTFRFELLEFLSVQPALELHASFSGRGRDGDDAALEAKYAQMNFWKLTLPVTIITFLKPLQNMADFSTLWDSSGHAAVHAEIPCWFEPDQFVAARRSPSIQGTPEFGLKSSTATPTMPLLMKLFCLTDNMHAIQLGAEDDTVGLAATLPAHGCIEEEHQVLAQVKQEGKNKNDADHIAGTANDSQDCAVWLLEVRSSEQRLAEAVAAILESQLRFLPEKAAQVSN